MRASIGRHQDLFNSALNDAKVTELLPVAPSSTLTLLAAKFIHEVARLLITEQDRALSNIVDDLVNGKYFKKQLDEDDDRTVPNQLAFAAIGWLCKIHILSKLLRADMEASATLRDPPRTFPGHVTHKKHSDHYG